MVVFEEWVLTGVPYGIHFSYFVDIVAAPDSAATLTGPRQTVAVEGEIYRWHCCHFSTANCLSRTQVTAAGWCRRRRWRFIFASARFTHLAYSKFPFRRR